MPIYDYSCTFCNNIKEDIFHSIDEIDNPTPETREEITCYCRKEGNKMHIVYQTPPSIKTPTRSRLLNVSRKKRNKNHFNKEILPDLEQDSKIHHLKKAGRKVDVKRMGLAE